MHRSPVQVGRRAGLALACLLAAPPGAAPVRGAVVGRVVHVGFPTDRGDVVRAGNWAPIVVDLSIENQSSFDGALRVEQRDQDGDRCYDRINLQLRSDAGAERHFTLFAIPHPDANGQISLEVHVLDPDDGRVEVISDGVLRQALRPANPPTSLSAEDYLVLAVSAGSVGQVARLGNADLFGKFDRNVYVAHVAPAGLPQRWLGLEAIDAIVWDAADATALANEQLEALREWTSQGGLLVVAAARTADTLFSSRIIGPCLPVAGGSVTMADELPHLALKLLNRRGGVYADPIPVVAGTPRPGARVLVRHAPGEDRAGALIARRRWGHGNVVFVGAELHHLLDGVDKPERFFQKLLVLRPALGSSAPVSPVPLYREINDQVGFLVTGGAYLAGAMFFAFAYLFGSTWGTWHLLDRWGHRRHNWSAFVVVALAASVFSVGAAQYARGVGIKLHALTVVDAEARVAGEAEGSNAASATCYFGVRTGTRRDLDFWLPADKQLMTEPVASDCFLRPMPSAETGSAGGAFADPGRYRLQPGVAVIASVPLRATLKQLEGRWAGVLPGTIDADITVGRNVDNQWAITEDSTLSNELGIDLHNCWLLQPLADTLSGKATGEIPYSWNAQRADGYVYAFPIHTLRDGQTVAPARLIYRDAKTQAPLSVETWTRQTLRAYQAGWGKSSARGLLTTSDHELPQVPQQPFEDALLLLSTLREFSPATLQSAMGMPVLFSAEHCRRLDLSDVLTKDVVMLIGFSNRPGPATLYARSGDNAYRPIRPQRAWTMYRFVIPVRRVEGGEQGA